MQLNIYICHQNTKLRISIIDLVAYVVSVNHEISCYNNLSSVMPKPFVPSFQHQAYHIRQNVRETNRQTDRQTDTHTHQVP